jgi:hypothetical protein
MTHRTPLLLPFHVAACQDAESLVDSIAPSSTEQETTWLMGQDAESVNFDKASVECPEEAFCSGTVITAGADPDPLWFASRPAWLAYAEDAADFIANFGEVFTEAAGGNPTAVLNREDAADVVERQTVLEFRYVDETSPSFDADSPILTYDVCGLQMDDKNTLKPLPASEQFQLRRGRRQHGTCHPLH